MKYTSTIIVYIYILLYDVCVLAYCMVYMYVIDGIELHVQCVHSCSYM